MSLKVKFPKKVRQQVLREAGWICVVRTCKGREGLQVHHIWHKSDKRVPTERLRNFGNGECACSRCHEFAHNNGLVSGIKVETFFILLSAMQEVGWIKKRETGLLGLEETILLGGVQSFLVRYPLWKQTELATLVAEAICEEGMGSDPIYFQSDILPWILPVMPKKQRKSRHPKRKEMRNQKREKQEKLLLRQKRIRAALCLKFISLMHQGKGKIKGDRTAETRALRRFLRQELEAQKRKIQEVGACDWLVAA